MRCCKSIKNKKGFTLVELIVVIAIIAILTAVLVPIIGNYTATAAQNTAQQCAGEAKTTISNCLSAYAANGVITASTGVTVTGTASGTPTVSSGDTGLNALIQNALLGMDDGDSFTAVIANNACTSVTYTRGSITVTV